MGRLVWSVGFHPTQAGAEPAWNTNKKNMIETKIITCPVHGEVKAAKHKNGNAASRFRCMKCSAEATQKIVEAKRDRAYNEFGSKCTVCGYDKCREALEWHHIDPSTKDITPAKVFSRSYDRILEELSKCVLLCANCHREEHVRLRNIGKRQ